MRSRNQRSWTTDFTDTTDKEDVLTVNPESFRGKSRQVAKTPSRKTRFAACYSGWTLRRTAPCELTTAETSPLTGPRSLCVQRSLAVQEPERPRSARATEILAGRSAAGSPAGGAIGAGAPPGPPRPRRPPMGGGDGEVLKRATYLSFDPGTSATHATWLVLL